MAVLRSEFDLMNSEAAGSLPLSALQSLYEHCLADVTLVLKEMRAFASKAGGAKVHDYRC